MQRDIRSTSNCSPCRWRKQWYQRRVRGVKNFEAMGSGNSIYVCNASPYEVYVTASPNPDWLIADVFVGVALFAVSLPAGGEGAITTLKAVEGLAELAHGIYDIVEVNHKLEEFFHGHGIPISPGSYTRVNFTNVNNPLNYFSPSAWGAITGGSDIALHFYAKTPSGVLLRTFNSNSDWSWVVNDTSIARQKYGDSLSNMRRDPEKGVYSWSDPHLKSNILPSPFSLFAYTEEFLKSNNGSYRAVMQADKNFVLYGPSGATWASNTWNAGSSSDVRVTMQDDGNLCVYSGDTCTWCSNTWHSGTAPYRLILQDTGNLQILDATSRVVWSKP
eukprot:TRINITY_DN8337_c0_g1_i7.p1 TRINITY_DN8337_c0_g1~~TRINITY_DN8337_c0_g1_i7.p1  ORF type:complete len:331 (+),score=48.01 TRINITY_DN8337_c0_g1_i7:614-1606(+)